MCVCVRACVGMHIYTSMDLGVAWMNVDVGMGVGVDGGVAVDGCERGCGCACGCGYPICSVSGEP